MAATRPVRTVLEHVACMQQRSGAAHTKTCPVADAPNFGLRRFDCGAVDQQVHQP